MTDTQTELRESFKMVVEMFIEFYGEPEVVKTPTEASLGKGFTLTKPLPYPYLVEMKVPVRRAQILGAFSRFPHDPFSAAQVLLGKA